MIGALNGVSGTKRRPRCPRFVLGVHEHNEPFPVGGSRHEQGAFLLCGLQLDGSDRAGQGDLNGMYGHCFFSCWGSCVRNAAPAGLASQIRPEVDVSLKRDLSIRQPSVPVAVHEVGQFDRLDQSSG